jgi:hypothetical protein|tara:strand:- start:686 stop:1090 length:405 start_codon:yes stop_codon:yes gene_type:complete
MYQQQSGEVLSAYCHMDGYLTGVGKSLLTHYNNDKMAHKLVANGYISSIYPTIDEINIKRANKDKPIFYYDLEDAISNIDALFIEYVYLWNGKSWEVSFADSMKMPSNSYGRRKYHHYHTNFKPLLDCLNREVA